MLATTNTREMRRQKASKIQRYGNSNCASAAMKLPNNGTNRKRVKSREQYPSFVLFDNFQNSSLCIWVFFYSFHLENSANNGEKRDNRRRQSHHIKPDNPTAAVNAILLLLYRSTLQPQHTFSSCKEKAIVCAKGLAMNWNSLLLRFHTHALNTLIRCCVPFLSFHLQPVLFFSCHFYVSKQCARS